MDPLLVSLRILHIVFGVFWAGTTFFLTLFLEPRLRSLGPEIQGRVMGALMPVLVPAMLGSSIVVIGSGVAIALILRWPTLDVFLTSGWGRSILVGFVASIVAFVVGFGLITTLALRIQSVARSMQGRPPQPEEAALLGRLTHRLETLSRINFILVLVAVGAMAAARFV